MNLRILQIKYITSGKGITATMGRNGFFNMIYFGFYHSTKQYIPASTDPKLGIL